MEEREWLLVAIIDALTIAVNLTSRITPIARRVIISVSALCDPFIGNDPSKGGPHRSAMVQQVLDARSDNFTIWETVVLGTHLVRCFKH